MKIAIALVCSLAVIGCTSGGDGSTGSSSGSGGSTGASSTSGSSTGGSGSTGEVQPQPPTITSFTATPAGLPPEGGAVTLSWTVTGAQTLDLEPGGINVTGLDAWVVTNVSQASTFRLLATNAAGTVSARVDVTLSTPSPLSGTVVYDDGTPAAYQHVLVLGHEVTLTAFDGTFTVADVITPYTLVVSNDDGSFNEIYVDAIEANPVVVIPQQNFEGVRVQTNSVYVGGPLLATNPDAGTSIFLATETDNESTNEGVGGSSYDLYANAPLRDGGAPGLVVATQTAQLDDGGWTWDQFGSTQVTFLDSSAVDAGITLAPTTGVDYAITATGVDPNAYSNLALGYTVGAVEPVMLNGTDLSPDSSTYDLSLPVATGLTPVLEASVDIERDFYCSAQANLVGFDASAPLTVQMPTAPLIASPLADSFGIPQTGASFSWAPTIGQDTLYALGLFAEFSQSSEPERTFIIVTRSPHFTMPDLSAIGLRLTQDAWYEMDTLSASPVSSMFDAEFVSLLANQNTPVLRNGQRFGYCYQDFAVGNPPEL